MDMGFVSTKINVKYLRERSILTKAIHNDIINHSLGLMQAMPTKQNWF